MPIKKDKRDRQYIYDVKNRWNTSALFILKLVMGETLDKLLTYRIVNSYLRDKDREDLLTNVLFVLFKPDDWPEFETFVEQQEQTKDFLEEYDYEGGYVVLVYRIPFSLKRDFEKFKEGKYSEFSASTKNLFKKMIPDGRMGKLQKSLQWEIFEKEPDLREQLEDDLDVVLPDDSEVWSIPSTIKETLNINQIRDNEEQRSGKSNRKAQRT